MSNATPTRYGVFAETEDGKTLWAVDLDLVALFAQVVMPCQDDEPFFIDGVSVTRNDLHRLKIVRLNEGFANALGRVDNFLHRKGSRKCLTAAEHRDKIDQLFRTGAVDVTHTVIDAYTKDAKPVLDKIDSQVERLSKLAELAAKLAPVLATLFG